MDGLGGFFKFITLYGFSSENWNRPASEVKDLMGLLRLYINRDLDELIKNNVRIRILGERKNLSADILKLVERAEKKSKDNTRFNLSIAFNYGGRIEIANAAQKIADEVKHGRLDTKAITPELFEQFLYTKDLPHPDLIIRTSGEKRMSNFLTWQSAYSELVFSDVLWPDFKIEHLLSAVKEYYLRERRYGGRPEECREDYQQAIVEFGKAG